MSMMRSKLAASVIAASAVLGAVGAAHGAAFVAWKVAGVSGNDLLNVRAYPSSGSRILVGYPNGTTLSMTGRCMNGVRLDDIGGQPGWKQRQAVRFTWCETWLDPDGDGDYESGWIYGRYIRPA